MLEEGAAYGTTREGGLVEWNRWQGTVVPCGLMAGHSFLIFHCLQKPQEATGPTDLDLQIASATLNI